MRLGSVDGPSLQLDVLGYQFGAQGSKVTDWDWDANWLLVKSTVTPGDRRGWSFTDACLTTFEARQLADWLRGVALGEVQPGPFDAESLEGLLWFTEPALAFSLADRSAEHVMIRVHLSLEALPVDVAPEQVEIYEYFVVVRMAPADLALAVEDWRRELSAYPVR